MFTNVAGLLLAVLNLCFSSFLGANAQMNCQLPNCITDTVQDLTVAVGPPGTAVVSWIPTSFPNISHYSLEFHPVSKSTAETVRVELQDILNDRVSHHLTGLMNFTSYDVSVRICTTNSCGPLTSREFVTAAVGPTANVTNLMANILPESESAEHILINISWSPISESMWNGIPRGYYVYLSGTTMQVHRVHYPDTSLVVNVQPGQYEIQISAVNNVSQSTLYSIIPKRGYGSSATTTNGDDKSFTDYPYFYMVIPGVVCLAIIAVVTIVIVKKIHENKKRSITFVRDINETGSINFKGFGNAVPLRELSPHSPNISASLPVSNVASPTSFHHHHQPLAQRPLPLSPTSEQHMQQQQIQQMQQHQMQQHQMQQQMMPNLHSAEDVFVVSSGHPFMNRHPGTLPMVDENVENSSFAVPMSRTMTSQSGGSVFSPVSSSSAPPAHQLQHVQQQQRGRANTLGGIPSPYEVPDTNNGNTLPHDVRSNSVHRSGASSIPPPPAHSPPTFTHSSSDIHEQMLDNHHHHHSSHPPQYPGFVPRQSTIPRAQANSRSFSTSSAQGRNVTANNRLTYIKSEGDIHDPIEDDVIYIQPPLDSDPEPSIISSSSYGQGSETVGIRRQSLDRGRHMHHHQQQHSRHPGMINGALMASSEQFPSIGEGPVPPSILNYHSPIGDSFPYPGPSGDWDRNPSRGRESLYSETSGEVSISGNSSEKGSSSGWDHRGARSDVGVGSRRQRSHSPPERETFSEVGARGNPPQFKQNGFV